MINKVMLIGNVGGDPEIKTVGDSKVANFSLATTESWKDKRSGDWVNKTEWHRIVVWGDGLVNYIQKNVTKGDRLYIEGSLQTNSWKDKDGIQRYTTEVALKPFNGTLKLLSAASNKDKSDQGQSDYGDRFSTRSLDDEIPF